MKRILFVAITIIMLCAGLARGADMEQWDQVAEGCPAGIHKQPNGPFAVMLFCEDALGTYLSVVYLDPIGAPHVMGGKWSLANRYWFDGLWGSDVTGYRWSKDGKILSVSTSAIYGAGGLFELELGSRKATQRLPEGVKVNGSNPGPGYTISGKSLEQR